MLSLLCCAKFQLKSKNRCYKLKNHTSRVLAPGETSKKSILTAKFPTVSSAKAFCASALRKRVVCCSKGTSRRLWINSTPDGIFWKFRHTKANVSSLIPRPFRCCPSSAMAANLPSLPGSSSVIRDESYPLSFCLSITRVSALLHNRVMALNFVVCRLPPARSIGVYTSHGSIALQ